MRLHLFFFLSLLGISGIAQTATWTGSVNNNWQTAANWNTSAVPASTEAVIINNTANQPVLDSPRSVASLTINSGAVLNLGSYNLTVSGSFTGNSATVNNGSLVTGSATVTNCTFGAKLTSIGATIQLRNNTFNEKVTVTQTGSSNTTSYGNTFNDPTRLTNRSAGFLSFGVGVADVFNDSLFATVTATRALYLAHSSAGNLFNGYVEFNKTSTATSTGVLVGSQAHASIFKSVVLLKAAAGAITTQNTSFTNCTFDSSASLSVSSGNFTHGQVSFSGCRIYPSVSITTGSSAQVQLTSGTIVYTAFTSVSPSVLLGAVEFKSTCSITKTGSSTDLSSGPIICRSTNLFKNTGTGLYWLGGAASNKFLQGLSVENTGAGTLQFTLTQATDSIVGSTSIAANAGVVVLGSVGTVNKPTLNGNITLNLTGGSVHLNSLKQGTSGSITASAFSGSLTLNDFKQLGTAAINLSGSGAFTVKSGTEIRGDLTISAGRIYVMGGEFFEEVFLNQTGSLASQGEGYPIFHKDAEFKCSGTGAFQLNYPYTTFTYHEDLILNNASGGLQLGYVGTHQVKGDVIFKGAHNINSWSNKIVLNGTLNQAIRREHGFTPTILRLEINKPSGKALLETPIVTLLDLSLQKGELHTTAANFPTLGSTATITGGSDSSYVAGPISKIGTAAFTFPTGGNGSYAPLGIDAVASSCTFRASYIAEDPDSLYPRSQKDSLIGPIEQSGYWMISRSSGQLSPKVLTYWNENSNFKYSPSNRRFIQWQNSKWSTILSDSSWGNHLIGGMRSNIGNFSNEKILTQAGIKINICAIPEIDLANNSSNGVDFTHVCNCSQNSINEQVFTFPNNSEKYYGLEFYKPEDQTDFIPQKTIHINLIILQRSDLNDPIDYFQEIPSHIDYLTKLFQDNPLGYSVQNTFLNNSNNTLGSSCVDEEEEVNSSRINFVLKKILFLPVSNAIFEYNGYEYRSDFFNEAISYFGECELGDNLNYFFCKNHSANGDPDAWGSAPLPRCDINFDMIPVSGAMYEKYVINSANGADGDLWSPSRHIAHELAHILDLNHLYDGSDDESNPNSVNYISDVYCDGFSHPFIAASNNNIMNGDWEHFYYSPLQVAKMHRSLSIKSTRKYVQGSPYSSIPIEIRKNEIWELDFQCYNDIIVRSGNTLEIRCKVLLSDQARIVVEPGAILYLNGGTLTGFHKMWQGVSVLGVANQGQGTVNLTTDGSLIDPDDINSPQGVVIIKNGTIENAEEGIFVGRGFGDLEYDKTGGIVIANDAIFKNNFRSVAFNPYKQLSVKSYFKRCSFICDAHLKNPNYYIPSQDRWQASRSMVTIWECNGIKFFGNRFENTIEHEVEIDDCGTTETRYFPPFDRTNGIGSWDARVIVQSFDPNEPNAVLNNDFVGLRAGIEFRNNNPLSHRHLWSYDSHFKNVHFGITLENPGMANIVRNEFQIASGEAPTVPNSEFEGDPYGIYAFKYSGVNVTNSTFTKFGSNSTSNWSLVLKGDPALNNSANINGNTFSELPIGIQTEVTAKHLQIDCNNFTDINKEFNIFPADISVDNGVRNFPNLGTGCGNPDNRVANIFNDPGPHIWDNAISNWRYFYREFQPAETPVFFNGSGGYNGNGADNGCSGQYSDPCASSGGGDGGKYAAIQSNRRMVESEIDATAVTLNAWQDNNGLETELLEAIADTNLSNDSLIQFAVDNSPLSDTVISGVIYSGRNLSASQAFSFLKASLPVLNTQWETCANFLSSDRNYDGIVDTLTSLQRFNPNTTTKTSLLRYKRHTENQLVGVVRQSIEYCLKKDSLQALIPLYRDSLIGRGYGKHLLGIALDLDSVDVAVQALDSLPSASEDDSLFKSFASLAISLKQDSLHWFQLNTLQMAELRNLSRISSSIQNNALSVRLLIGDTLYHHNPDPSPSGNARLAAPSSNAATQVWESAHVKLMPNPNLGTFQVQILDGLQGNIQWEMVDLTGRLMLQGQSNQSMFTIQASQLSKGIYVLKMRAPNGSMYKVERVIIR